MAIFTDLDGVYGSAIHSGIKPRKTDLSYIFVPDSVACAAVFTLNKVVAAPILVSKATKNVKAVIINSGNANAVTGKEGMKNAKKMAELTAKKLGIKSSQVMVASTGIIGVQLPMKKVEAGIQTLLKDPLKKDGDLVAQGILTTDTTVKVVNVTGKIAGKKVVISGIVKGSGMIAPNMATMLAFMVTDVDIKESLLKKEYRVACAKTFNQISVDSDTSTNDMSMIFATGKQKIDWSVKANLEAFRKLLYQSCLELAIKIVEDGEGMTKMIEVHVESAASEKDATGIAKQVIDSPLVKTAIHGCDPNWGRILAAAGKDPKRKVIQEKIDLFILGVQIMKTGEITQYDEAKLSQKMKDNDTIKIRLCMHVGKSEGMAWGCDLTKRYIEINTDYN